MLNEQERKLVELFRTMMRNSFTFPAELARKIRFLPETNCWHWLGKWNSGNGYSKCRYEGRVWQVHCLIYTLLVGPIPEGLILDHTCRDRACCNPLHLEPVTHAVNTHRGNAVLFRKETGNEDQ